MHRRLDNGKVFYIGKGTGNRAWLRDGRKSIAWKAIVQQTDYYVDIYRSNLLEQEALDLEKELICNPVKAWKLVNHTLDTSTKQLNYLFLSKIVSYDELSPSGLVWKKPLYRNKVGSVVGSLKYHKNGKPHKWVACINRALYPIHRIIYLLNNPEFDQTKLINHIDCNPQNNNINNLELVTKSENNNRTVLQTKSQLKSNNTSGLTNIYFCKNKNSFSIIVRWIKDNKLYSKSFLANFVNFDHMLEQAITLRDINKQRKT